MHNNLKTPDWVAERCKSLGGTNRFGGANFRVVWGGSRLHKVGGFFPVNVNGVITQVAEVREVHKYHPERWHLERWIAPEVYGDQEEWYRQTWNELAKVHTCGDYPAEGDYEHVFVLAKCEHVYKDEEEYLKQHPLPYRSQFLDFGEYTKAVVEWQEQRANGGIGEWCNRCKLTLGEYIPLEENMYLVELQIHAFTLSDYVTERQEREALFARELEKKKASMNRIETIVRNRMMAFGTVPHSYATDPNRKCSVPEAKFNPRIYNPFGRSAFKQLGNEKIN